MTKYERSKALVKLAEAVNDVDQHELRGKLPCNGQAGRHAELGSTRRIAERIGEDPRTIDHARAQLAVVEACKAARVNALAIARVKTTGKAFDAAISRWQASCLVTEEATDALLALKTEGKGD